MSIKITGWSFKCSAVTVPYLFMPSSLRWTLIYSRSLFSFLFFFFSACWYRLVRTQMGDNFKRQIFDEQMQEKIQGWAMSAKGRRKSEAGLSSVFKGFLSRKTEDDAGDAGPRSQRVSESAHNAQHAVNVGEIVESVSVNSDLRPPSWTWALPSLCLGWGYQTLAWIQAILLSQV